MRKDRSVALVCLLFAGAFAGGAGIEWQRLSSARGDLPVPGDSTQQTGAVVADLDRDGCPPTGSPNRYAGGAETFRRGDTNADGAWDVVDVANVLKAVFAGDALPCADAADVNDDGVCNVADGIALLSFLLDGEGPPAPPFAAPGPDPTPDAIDCRAASRHDPVQEHGVSLGFLGEFRGGRARSLLGVTTTRALAALQFAVRVEGVEGAAVRLSAFEDVAFSHAARRRDGATFMLIPTLHMDDRHVIRPSAGLALCELEICLPAGTPRGVYRVLLEDARVAVSGAPGAHVPLASETRIHVLEDIPPGACREPQAPPEPSSGAGLFAEYVLRGPAALGGDAETLSIALLCRATHPPISFDLALDYDEYALSLAAIEPRMRLAGEHQPRVSVLSDSPPPPQESSSSERGYVVVLAALDVETRASWEPDRLYEVARATFRVHRTDERTVPTLLRAATVGPEGAYGNRVVMARGNRVVTLEPLVTHDSLAGGAGVAHPRVAGIR